KPLEPQSPFLFVGEFALRNGVDVGVVEQQPAQADLALWLEPKCTAQTLVRAQWLVQVGAERAEEFEHRQMRELLVVESMPPDVLIYTEVDALDLGAFEDLAHCGILTITGRVKPRPPGSMSMKFSVSAE